VSRLLHKHHFHAVTVRVYSTWLNLGVLLAVPDKARA
jgi:hypothetical protein